MYTPRFNESSSPYAVFIVYANFCRFFFLARRRKGTNTLWFDGGSDRRRVRNRERVKFSLSFFFPLTHRGFFTTLTRGTREGGISTTEMAEKTGKTRLSTLPCIHAGGWKQGLASFSTPLAWSPKRLFAGRTVSSPAIPRNMGSVLERWVEAARAN